ncbi:hypothetical protein KC973_03750 [Candidatus Saccharibacteria bacterium]|nr:hypothetical protein [Candidatus Saccharibacteria bacterium]
MHEAFSGSPETRAQNSAEILELTPVNYESTPLDGVKQRTMRGAMPLANVGQEAQMTSIGEADIDRAIAERAMAAGVIADLRAYKVRELRDAA